MAKESRDLIPNFITDRYDWFGQGISGGDPGLQLWVRSSLIQDSGEQLVPCAEIISERDDILYGSFRIAMKTTGVNGTCGAFYFYRNESQEIDLEVISSEQQQASQNGWPVHLVVQSTHNTPLDEHHKSRQLIYHLPFATGGADADYNEFRFDRLPNRIDYFLNSHFMWSVTDSIPSTPGRIHISHCKETPRAAMCMLGSLNCRRVRWQSILVKGTAERRRCHDCKLCQSLLQLHEQHPDI